MVVILTPDRRMSYHRESAAAAANAPLAAAGGPLVTSSAQRRPAIGGAFGDARRRCGDRVAVNLVLV
jgi:hypothetical protein